MNHSPPFFLIVGSFPARRPNSNHFWQNQSCTSASSLAGICNVLWSNLPTTWGQGEEPWSFTTIAALPMCRVGQPPSASQPIQNSKRACANRCASLQETQSKTCIWSSRLRRELPFSVTVIDDSIKTREDEGQSQPSIGAAALLVHCMVLG